jgi:hypothetical protein
MEKSNMTPKNKAILTMLIYSISGIIVGFIMANCNSYNNNPVGYVLGFPMGIGLLYIITGIYSILVQHFKNK